MKKFIFTLEILIVVCLIVVAIVMFVPGTKTKFLSSFLGCSIGQGIAGCLIGDEYEEFVQKKEFDDSTITINEGVEISDDYTNIALFGCDANESSVNGLLGEGAHSDSIIILSINNKTGEMKMVSLYRDTFLEYIVQDVNYGKATNAMFFGGVDSSLNMINKNLDLNIKDYIVINYAGLANIIDQLGGINVNITPDEMYYINAYLVDVRLKTGKEAPDVTTSGEVQLTGLQAVSYCRIRYCTYTDSEGTQFIDDYGRTERQKSVLKLTLQKMKDAGAKDLYKISKELLSENSPEEKFIETSMSLDETLEIVGAVLEMEVPETSGFPQERGSATISGQSYVIPDTLESNVSILHEYLFGSVGYTPTDSVHEISENIIDRAY